MPHPITCTRCRRRFGGHETWVRHFLPRTNQERCRSDRQLRDAGFYPDDRTGIWHRVPEAQLSLLSDSVGGVANSDARVLARVTDPETSHNAARAVAYRTGTAKARLLAVYLEEPSGLTDEEAATRVGMDLYAASKRCSDLRRDGVIVPVGIRKGRSGLDRQVCAVAQEATG
jgi:hypothetical protein